MFESGSKWGDHLGGGMVPLIHFSPCNGIHGMSGRVMVPLCFGVKQHPDLEPSGQGQTIRLFRWQT
jgi:hypothetical protein